MTELFNKPKTGQTPSPIKKLAKRIKISLKDQLLHAYLGENLVFKFSCVTGDAKHPTPKGNFKILKKTRVYRSKTYDSQMNYAIQITTSGIFIHESYNYIEDPKKQNPFSTVISDTAAVAMSRMRSWFPMVGEINVPVGNINLTGSHGCIRLAHSDAVKLFDWSEVNIAVEIN